MIAAIMKRLAVAFLVLAAAAPLSAAQAGDSAHLLPGTREQWMDDADTILNGNDEAAAGAADPLRAPMNLCENSGCTQTGWQTLNETESGRVRALFAARGDAVEERAQLGKAVALLEAFMGGRNGTWRDRAANERDGDGDGDGEAGQLDCIAESVNTHTYLDRLSRAGLLRHHQPGDFIHRYTVVLQHVAVEIIETGTDDRFAVDSWVGANGEEPEILPYSDWRWEWGV